MFSASFMPDHLADPDLTLSDAWTLDKLGNWDSFLKRTNDVTITEPRTNNKANEYLTIDPDGSGGSSPLTLAHDHNGNLTDDGTYLYDYDIENRMTRVRLKSGTVLLADYHYDALGRRIRKIIPTGQPDAGTWTYVVNELWQVVSEYKTVSSTTTHQKRFVHAGQSAYVDDHVAMWDIVAGKLIYYHADAQYCTAAMTHTAGAVEERYVTDPYGKAVTYNGSWGSPQATSRLGNPFIHQGLWLDGECGKYQNRRREYLPSQGSFAQRDPIGYSDGANLASAYAGNPLQFGDPNGTICGLPGSGYPIICSGEDLDLNIPIRTPLPPDLFPQPTGPQGPIVIEDEPLVDTSHNILFCFNRFNFCWAAAAKKNKDCKELARRACSALCGGPDAPNFYSCFSNCLDVKEPVCTDEFYDDMDTCRNDYENCKKGGVVIGN